MGGRMNDSGISTVIGVILILGLIISIAAVVKLTYIPDVKKQLEADHMQKVIGDIGTFKAQLDLDQAAAAAGVGFTTNANIEMGGGAIPGIDPSTSYGTLTLDPAYGQLTIVAYQYPSGTPLNLGSAIAMGRLVFQSNTRYYPNQNVSYECGMITLSQPGGTVMLTPPSFIISADSGVAGRPIVTVNALRLNGTAQTFSSGGTGTIRTWLVPGSTAYASTNVTNVTFTIVSSNAALWYTYLSGMLASSGLAAGNYALAQPDANTITLRINGIGTQNTGLYLADSSFGTSMGYTSMPPGYATPTPTPTPTPAPLAANFQGSPTTGTGPLTVDFTDLSTGTPGSWQWSFGDSTANMTTQSGSHTYAAVGNYTVTLTVYNATTHVTTQKVAYIKVIPLVAGFTANATSGFAPLAVAFTDTSTGSPVLWQWNFGDGSVNLTTQSAVHTFNAPGTYTVTLTVYNVPGGGPSSTQQTITVSPVSISDSMKIAGTYINSTGGEPWRWYYVSVATTISVPATNPALNVLVTVATPSGAKYSGVYQLPAANPQTIPNAASPKSYSWMFLVYAKTGDVITFNISAKGDNTAQISDTITYTIPTPTPRPNG